MASEKIRPVASAVSDNDSPLEKGKKIMKDNAGNQGFSAGQKVFHPFYGVGTVIKGDVEKKILGKKTHFSVFRFQSKRLRLMIKTGNDTMISQLFSKDELSRAMEVLRNGRKKKTVFPKRHSHRYNAIVGKLKSGSLIDLAEVIHALSEMRQTKKLSVKEQGLFNSARQVFCETLSNVRDIPEDEAQEILSEII